MTRRSSKGQAKRAERSAHISIVINQLRANGISDPAKLASVLNTKGLLNLNDQPWSVVDILRHEAKPPPEKVLNAVLQLMKYGMI